MSSFNKNGIITASIFTESKAESLVSKDPMKYTPAASITNSCMERDFTGLIEGDTYIITMLISWKFATFPSGFDFWLRGAQHHKTNGWGWTTASYPMNAVMTALGSTNGRLTEVAEATPTLYGKKIITEFTCPTNYDGFGIGCRCDNSDGNSWIEMRDIYVIPKKIYVGQLSGKTQSIKIKSDDIIFDNIEEY